MKCEYTGPDNGVVIKGHSDDLIEVYSGSTDPIRLCGFHERYYHADALRYVRKKREAQLKALRDVEFDHVFVVDEDRSITDAVDLHAPEVYHDEHADITIDGVPWKDSRTWSPLIGYTGQYSYNGAVMHPSEYLGGRIADDVLQTPGTYVVVTVEVLPEDDDPEPEPAGWAVLRRMP